MAKTPVGFSRPRSRPQGGIRRERINPAVAAGLLAEQYALLRVLLGLLPFPEGETEEQHLVKAIVALTRITQHSDMGKQVYDIGRAFQMDSLAHAAYLLQ